MEKMLASEINKVIEELEELKSAIEKEFTSGSSSVPLPLHVEDETNKTEVEEEEQVAVQVVPDDMALFLIFSRKHPISEEEVERYFTKRFGEVIEAIQIPHFEEGEEPSFGMMILRMRYASVVQEMVSTGKGRDKFIIEGKHAWVRKYARKI